MLTYFPLVELVRFSKILSSTAFRYYDSNIRARRVELLGMCLSPTILLFTDLASTVIETVDLESGHLLKQHG